MKVGALRRAKGFTLIELALVALLISISLLIFAPAVSTLVSSYKQDSALLRIETFLNYHQGEVERSGKERRFCLDLEKGEYWAELKEDDDFFEVTEVLGKRTVLPRNLFFVDLLTLEGKFSEGIGDFSISLFSIEPAIIHLKDKEERQYSLYWKPLSGKIEIYDGYIEEEEAR
ncbi:MAG: hypothetical protein KAX20_04800 [Candidatus Omnitrophica bacterium]|nr:hypothetical protein [Candidatus Omnitrophota bacterium]